MSEGESARRGFFGWFEADHPAPSTLADADRVALVLALPETRWSPPEDGRAGTDHAPSLLARAPRLRCDPIDDAALAAHAPGPC